MREQQFIRFVEEICFLLKLSQPCSKTALQYFLQFKEYEGHKFDQEILIAACIYLSSKIFEQQVRVRDILNMTYVLTTTYKLARYEQEKQKEKQKEKCINNENSQKNEKQYQQLNLSTSNNVEDKMKQEQNQILQQHYSKIDLEKNQKIMGHQEQRKQQNKHSISTQQFILLKAVQKHPDLQELIQPHYSLSDYNQYKGKIIEAEQVLLRILGFDFSLSQRNKTQLKQLLLTLDYLQIPSSIGETILKVYNDVHYIDVGCWLQGLVYFGFLLIKNLVIERKKSQIEQKQQTLTNQHKESTKTDKKQPSQRQLKQTKRIEQFIQKMDTAQKWQLALCTTIKQLQTYAQKLTNFYLSIQID